MTRTLETWGLRMPFSRDARYNPGREKRPRVSSGACRARQESLVREDGQGMQPRGGQRILVGEPVTRVNGTALPGNGDTDGKAKGLPGPQSNTDSRDMNLGELREMLRNVYGVAKSWT